MMTMTSYQWFHHIFILAISSHLTNLVLAQNHLLFANLVDEMIGDHLSKASVKLLAMFV